MTDEREIDLLDLLAEVLRHWKGTILFLLIVVAILGAYNYVKEQKEAAKISTAAETVEHNAEETPMTYAEKKAVDIALEYEKLYVEAKDNGDVENQILLNRSVIDSVKAFNEKQIVYFNENSVSELWKDTEIEIESVKELITAQEEERGVSGIKLIIIGALAFAFVYCMIWAVKYIFDGSLKVSDDLQQLIGVPHIGEIITVGEPSFAIDRWAYRLKHHGRQVLPVEDSLELIASVISVNAKKGELSEVAFAGCSLKKKAYEYCEKLAAILKNEHGIDSKILEDVVYDKDDVEALADSKGVVLIETAGASAYSDLQKEMQLINQLSINVIGGVILE